MNKFIFALLFFCNAAFAEPVLIMLTGEMIDNGEVIEQENQNGYFLYPHRKCRLPIVHAKEMRGYVFMVNGKPNIYGCYARLLNGNIMTIDSDGSKFSSPAFGYSEAKLMNGELKMLKAFDQGELK